MAYYDNKDTNQNTSLPSSGKGGSVMNSNLKTIAKKFQNNFLNPQAQKIMIQTIH